MVAFSILSPYLKCKLVYNYPNSLRYYRFALFNLYDSIEVAIKEMIEVRMIYIRTLSMLLFLRKSLIG
jgi:hypothetical protein